jgi:hypothetical protein
VDSDERRFARIVNSTVRKMASTFADIEMRYVVSPWLYLPGPERAMRLQCTPHLSPGALALMDSDLVD